MTPSQVQCLAENTYNLHSPYLIKTIEEDSKIIIEFYSVSRVLLLQCCHDTITGITTYPIIHEAITKL